MNLIFCAYAYKQGFQSGHNINNDDTQNIYLKNAFVSLYSAKLFNKNDYVALFTNIRLNDYWRDLFNNNGINVHIVPFDKYVFNENYNWSLAYYKLCALTAALDMNFNNICLIDTDTYTQRKFEDIWIECSHNIMLYDISRGLYNSDYSIFFKECMDFLQTTEILTRWGGEFIAGSKSNLKLFLNQCSKIYEKMIKEEFVTINGDEFIISVAAHLMRDKIKNASAYVFRYWTSYRWHYVCSNYKHNPVCILHCPREKEHGFIKLFEYCIKHRKLPNISRVYSILRLDTLSYLKIQIIQCIIKRF